MKKDLYTYFINAFFFVVAIVFTTIFILSLLGCAKKEIEYKDKIIMNYIPVPTKCELNITHPPIIMYDTLQNRVKSITELAFDGVKLREELFKIPCLKINYIKDLIK